MELAAYITPPILIAAYTLLSIIFRWSPRIPLAGALVLLVAAGLTFLFGAQRVADHLAFSVFYCLLSGAILLAVNRIREGYRE